MRHSRLYAILLLCAVSLAACSAPEGGVATPSPSAGTTPTTGGEAVASATAPQVVATATAGEAATETPTGSAAQPTGIVAPTATVPAAVSPTAAPDPQPTATPAEVAPTPTPTLPSTPGSLRVEQWGYSQAEAYAEVTWGVLISNQHQSSAVLDTAYALTFLDESGETIEIDEGYIDIILPGARIGIGGSTFLPEGAIARSMRVDVLPGYLAEPSLDATITITDVTYVERSLFPIATGSVSLSFDRPLTDVEVYAVGFDRDGEIIGGGKSHLPFILPDEPVGVEVSISSVGYPARVELYPLITAATVHADEMARLDPVEPAVTVVDQGWGVVAASGEVGWAFLLHNPSDALAVEPVLYQVTAWAADGTVLATNPSSVAILLPGERLGVAGSVFVPAGADPDHVDVQVLGRSSHEIGTAAGFLTIDDVQLVPDALTPRATGVVISTLDSDLGPVTVFAVGYDADDAIIGGGVAFIEALPARGKAPVEVALALGGDPVRVELYATASSPSQIP